MISVNMQFAAMAVNEFLARLHPYRFDQNREFAVDRPSLIQVHLTGKRRGRPAECLARNVGPGRRVPAPGHARVERGRGRRGELAQAAVAPAVAMVPAGRVPFGQPLVDELPDEPSPRTVYLAGEGRHPLVARPSSAPAVAARSSG